MSENWNVASPNQFYQLQSIRVYRCSKKDLPLESMSCTQHPKKEQMKN